MSQLNGKGAGKENPKAVHAVDLFCGAGGLTHGLRRAGLSVSAGIDLDPDCEFPFQTNNATPFLQSNVASLSAKHLLDLFPKTGHRVLAGCAPCQPFSRYARACADKYFQKWGLLDHFFRLAKDLRPAVVTMENVPEIQIDAVFRKFVEHLRDSGYMVTYSNIFCPDYGVPQNRSRLVLFASLYGTIALEPPTLRCAPSNGKVRYFASAQLESWRRPLRGQASPIMSAYAP